MSNVGVPFTVLIITSIFDPSSHTSPPPDMLTSGSGFTLIIVASVRLVSQPLLSLTDKNVYVEVVEGLADIESEMFDRAGVL